MLKNAILGKNDNLQFDILNPQDLDDLKNRMKNAH